MALRTLMSHQEDAKKYCIKVLSPALFMQMRLGKTLTVIRWVQSLREQEARVILVAAPLTVLEAWKHELSLEGEPYLDLHEVPLAKREAVIVEECLKSNHRVWLLVSYGKLLRIPELAHVKWDLVILDESIKIKNPSAKLTKYCTRGFNRAKRRAILTGLPSTESYMEFFSQFQFLDGQFMGFKNFWSWKIKYFQPPPWGKGEWVPKKGTRELIRKEIEKRAFILTRSQAGMKAKKVYSRRFVEMNPAQEKAYKSIVKDYMYRLDDGTFDETQWSTTAALWLQRLTGGFSPDGTQVLSEAKFNEVMDLIKDELRGEQLVVWFKFRSELVHMEEKLKKARIKTCLIHGDIPQREREEAIQIFRAKKAQVLLATEKCAKMGIDCSSADTEIYYSNEWSLDDRLQSEERIQHPKKKVPVLIIDLITKGTIEEDLYSALQNKSFNARMMLLKHMKVTKENIKR